MTYIDLNMVRAGVVRHPSQWPFSGYVEIQNPPRRYSVIDRKSLMELYEKKDDNQLSIACQELTEEFLAKDQMVRNEIWSESIAIGSKSYIEKTKEILGINSTGRKILQNDEDFIIRESLAPYKAHFTPKKEALSPQNTYFWQ